MIEVAIEKERKWLLKRTPEIPEEFLKQTFVIVQFYSPDGWRYRMRKDVQTDEMVFQRMKKISISTGINQELNVENIPEKEFEECVQGLKESVTKIRHVFKIGEKIVEIDEFLSCTLIIMEIENVEIDEEIILPEYINREILMEVTSIKEFNNKNLANEHLWNN